MQPDRRRVSSYWLAVADQDLAIARAHTHDAPNAACFHAQQATEKALKGLLVQLAGDVERTHVAAELIEEVIGAGAMPDNDVRRAAIRLDRYYVTTRYPDAMGDADPTASFFAADAVSAILDADTVILWVRSELTSHERS